MPFTHINGSKLAGSTNSVDTYDRDQPLDVFFQLRHTVPGADGKPTDQIFRSGVGAPILTLRSGVDSDGDFIEDPRSRHEYIVFSGKPVRYRSKENGNLVQPEPHQFPDIENKVISHVSERVGRMWQELKLQVQDGQLSLAQAESDLAAEAVKSCNFFLEAQLDSKLGFDVRQTELRNGGGTRSRNSAAQSEVESSLA